MEIYTCEIWYEQLLILLFYTWYICASMLFCPCKNYYGRISGNKTHPSISHSARYSRHFSSEEKMLSNCKLSIFLNKDCINFNSYLK